MLEPHPGLTVVTGETGAGKTMVVTALGPDHRPAGRCRAGCGPVRSGPWSRHGPRIGGRSGVARCVEELGGELDDDGSVILLRTVGADGRSRAHIGGRSAPVGALAQVTEPLMAVHGQSETVGLLHPANQRAVLDRFAGNESRLEAFRAARAAWLAPPPTCESVRCTPGSGPSASRLLRLAVTEIDRTAPAPEEDTAVAEGIRRLENVDALRVAAEQARQLLAGDSEPELPHAVGRLEAARRLLDSSGDGRLAGRAADLHQASAVVLDVAAELTGFLVDLDADPDRLEQLLGRQAELRALARRYGPDVRAVLDFRAQAERELADLDGSDDALATVRGRCHRLEHDLAAAAADLSAHRRTAAADLGARATAELSGLAMARARVHAHVDPRRGAPGAPDVIEVDGEPVVVGVDGIDTVEILLRAHPTAPALPLARGASGGELSRVMLALEVVLAAADPVGTLVFDEVDAGVGGRAATQVGSRLAALARSHQVVVVTHLAQVAAFADRHVVVDAADDGSVRRTALREVRGTQRLVELARMLGGTDGRSARAHATELLTAASSGRG